jgi:hypothetical protein
MHRRDGGATVSRGYDERPASHEGPPSNIVNTDNHQPLAPTALPRPAPRRDPQGGSVYAVRWRRHDGREYRQRLYRQRRAALIFAARLQERGKQAHVFASPVTWQEVDTP